MSDDPAPRCRPTPSGCPGTGARARPEQCPARRLRRPGIEPARRSMARSRSNRGAARTPPERRTSDLRGRGVDTYTGDAGPSDDLWSLPRHRPAPRRGDLRRSVPPGTRRLNCSPESADRPFGRGTARLMLTHLSPGPILRHPALPGPLLRRPDRRGDMGIRSPAQAP